MAITRTLRFMTRPWSIPAGDPGLPAGHWVAAGSQPGDASGAPYTWQHIFAAPASELGDPSSLYSIEQVMLMVTVAANDSVELTVLGMDAGVFDDVGLPVTCGYTFSLANNGVSACDQFGDFGLPIWLGRHAGTPTTVAIMNLRLNTNPGAVEVFRVKVQGYYWSPEAVNAPGGLRKPLGGIYTR